MGYEKTKIIFCKKMARNHWFTIVILDNGTYAENG